nr:hypothetical protein [Pseudomonas sp. BIGb0427]
MRRWPRKKNLSPEARLAQFPQQIEAAFLSAYKELVKAAKAEAASKYEEIQRLEERLRARWTANAKKKIRLSEV